MAKPFMPLDLFLRLKSVEPDPDGGRLILRFGPPQIIVFGKVQPATLARVQAKRRRATKRKH